MGVTCYRDEKVLEKVLVDIEPNHPKLNAVLGNKYNDGSDYIGFHSDSESDLHNECIHCFCFFRGRA